MVVVAVLLPTPLLCRMKSSILATGFDFRSTRCNSTRSMSTPVVFSLGYTWVKRTAVVDWLALRSFLPLPPCRLPPPVPCRPPLSLFQQRHTHPKNIENTQETQVDTAWINHTSQGEDGESSAICWSREGGAEYCVDVPDDVSLDFTSLLFLSFIFALRFLISLFLIFSLVWC